MTQRFTLLFLLAGWTGMLFAQSAAQDATVALRATVDTIGLSITLDWPNPSASTIMLKRREKGQAANQWIQILNEQATTLATYTDTSLIKGSTYEYSIRRTTTYPAFGYAQVAVLTPFTDYRGKILIFIDSTTADATGLELKQFKDGLRGDGWQPVPVKTGPSATVQTIKNRIVEDYNADPDQVKAVLLIGEIPVPYSGNAAWDGHSDHGGAWPSDNYYADVNGTWTDVFVNNTTPGRNANDNVPGDGKFDQNAMPSAAELLVGRIDFRHLDSTVFGASPTELIRRYFIKNVKWRTKQYTVRNKALVDDNFGYFNGEAFAADGYRNAYPLVGAENVVTGDFLTATDTATFLLGYGCGGGSYTSASGIGNSTQIAADSINIVFSNIFGSYHGDWDYENNPLMPSALASKGGILTCSWAGRPHWFMQALASGETIGYCTKETMNAQYNSEYWVPSTYSMSGAHVALLGDPTVRAHIVAPVPEMITESTCTSVGLKWQASPDTDILGYHVYRSLALDGPYLRQTDALVTALSWTDLLPVADTVFYQVRPVRIDHAPGGGYFYNAGTGIIQQHIHTGAPVATLTSTYPVLDCYSASTQLVIAVDDPGQPLSISISGPQPVDSSLIISTPGIYTLLVKNMNNGCATESTHEITSDFSLPVILAETITNVSAPGASDGAIDIQVPFGVMYNFVWQDGMIGPHLTGLSAGTYTVAISNSFNGCSILVEYQIDVSTGVGESPAQFAWTLAPNPAAEEVTLRLENPDVRMLQVEISHSDGRLLEQLFPKSIQQTFTIDVHRYPPGVYLAAVVTDRGRSTRWLMVNR